MVATIQPRHVRLWIAAQSRNWPFAAYELGNLKRVAAAVGLAQCINWPAMPGIHEQFRAMASIPGELSKPQFSGWPCRICLGFCVHACLSAITRGQSP
jgi:hypothetical protein